MKELLNTIEYLQNYGKAIEEGVNKFVESVPIYTKQHINRLAKRNLDSTAEHYMNNVTVKMSDYLLIVELNKEDWLVNAVESGVSGFNLKETILSSPKAKMSSKGFRYMSIPMGQKRGRKRGTEEGKQFQAKIDQILLKPKFGLMKMNITSNGKIVQSQQVITADPTMKGLYRTRMFDTAEEFHSAKKKGGWQFVLFRTISENPVSKTGATWKHPGIKPVNILKKTERWLNDSAGELLSGLIEAEVETLNKSFFGGK